MSKKLYTRSTLQNGLSTKKAFDIFFKGAKGGIAFHGFNNYTKEDKAQLGCTKLRYQTYFKKLESPPKYSQDFQLIADHLVSQYDGKKPPPVIRIDCHSVQQTTTDPNRVVLYPRAPFIQHKEEKKKHISYLIMFPCHTFIGNKPVDETLVPNPHLNEHTFLQELLENRFDFLKSKSVIIMASCSTERKYLQKYSFFLGIPIIYYQYGVEGASKFLYAVGSEFYFEDVIKKSYQTEKEHNLRLKRYHINRSNVQRFFNVVNPYEYIPTYIKTLEQRINYLYHPRVTSFTAWHYAYAANVQQSYMTDYAQGKKSAGTSYALQLEALEKKINKLSKSIAAEEKKRKKGKGEWSNASYQAKKNTLESWNNKTVRLSVILIKHNPDVKSDIREMKRLIVKLKREAANAEFQNFKFPEKIKDAFESKIKLLNSTEDLLQRIRKKILDKKKLTKEEKVLMKILKDTK